MEHPVGGRAALAQDQAPWAVLCPCGFTGLLSRPQSQKLSLCSFQIQLVVMAFKEAESNFCDDTLFSSKGLSSVVLSLASL